MTDEYLLVPFNELNIQVVRDTVAWPTPLRRASLNSFGYGGANAHVILESADSVIPGYNQSKIDKSKIDPRQRLILPISSTSSKSLHSRVEAISDYLRDEKPVNIHDLCYTLANRRSCLRDRGYLFASQATLKADFTRENLITANQERGSRLPICFVFTGQGSQWPQMGKELFATYPEYRRTLEYLDSVLSALPEAPTWTLRHALCEPSSTSRVGEVEQSQPLCTALQIGLVNLLRSWGVRPSASLGHSSGEIAAAYAAGLVTASEAIVIAYYRGYVVGRSNSRGAMLAAGMSAAKASAMIKERSLTDQVSVACINSPESVTISGTIVGIDKCFEVLRDKNIFVLKLSTGGRAYHSYLMKVMGAEYEDKLMARIYNLPENTGDVSHNAEKLPMFSSLGVGAEDLACLSNSPISSVSPVYWRRNLELPVQFYGAMANLIASAQYHMIEIGPHAALQLPIQQIRTSLSLSGG